MTLNTKIRDKYEMKINICWSCATFARSPFIKSIDKEAVWSLLNCDLRAFFIWQGYQ